MADATLVLRADTRGLKKATDGLKKVERQAEKTSRATKNLGKSFVRFGKLAGAATGVLAGLFTRQVIKNTVDQQKAVAQLNAVLKSTGRDSEVASQGLRDYAKELQAITTFGDEAILGAESLLLTFKQIGGDTFPRATKAILDMSIAMDQGLKESTIQLGKALNDPITGLTALQRVGITFTDSQKDMIKTMQQAGDIAGAQALILNELESQFEGSAEAARDTFGGAMEAVGNAFGDLLEGEGGSGGLNGATAALNDLVDLLNEPSVKQGFQDMAQGALEFFKVLVQLPGAIGFVADEFRALFGIIDEADFVRRDDEIQGLIDTLESLRTVQAGANFGVDQTGVSDRIAALTEEIRLKKESLEADQQAALAGGDGGGAASVVAENIKAVTSATEDQNDAKEETIKLIKIEQELLAGSAASDMLRDLSFETELIGKNNEEREVMTALRALEEEQLIRRLELGAAGAAQNEAENEQIIEAIRLKHETIAAEDLHQEALARTAELAEQQAEATAAFYREIGNNAATAFGDFVTGSKSAKDAFKDFSNQIIKDLIRIAIQKAITAAIGGGTSGFGDTFAGIFGPSRAVGGRIHPGTMHQVGERGPELLTTGGRSVVVGGPQGGNVTPITNNQKSSVTNVYNLPVATPRETPEQIAYALNRVQNKAHARLR
jgi:hypothetical protein